MSSPYPLFDVSRLRLLPLQEREHDLDLRVIKNLEALPGQRHPQIDKMAGKMRAAKAVDATRVFLCGAHVLRSGVQRYLFDLMEKGWISGIALNGAGAIHDFELALIGATTESVARYIVDGKFGLWQETGRINDILAHGAAEGLGFGAALGREIYEGDYPHKECSLFAKAWELRIPLTVHVGIGYDIIHAHPNMDGAVTGLASYRDFLIFVRLLENIPNGCVCTFGSAVMAPEVFLKALSMVRNVATQEGRGLDNFSSLVCDLVSLEEDVSKEASKNDARYYFRPWKTLLARTLAGEGESMYVQGRHEHTIPMLWKALTHAE